MAFWERHQSIPNRKLALEPLSRVSSHPTRRRRVGSLAGCCARDFAERLFDARVNGLQSTLARFARAMANKAEYAQRHGMAISWSAALLDADYEGAWNKVQLLHRVLRTLPMMMLASFLMSTFNYAVDKISPCVFGECQLAASDRIHPCAGSMAPPMAGRSCHRVDAHCSDDG